MLEDPAETLRLRKEGIVKLPEDLGIDRSTATRELLAAKNMKDLVDWSGDSIIRRQIPQLVISHISKNLLPFLFRATGFYFNSTGNIILFHPEKGYLPCG